MWLCRSSSLHDLTRVICFHVPHARSCYMTWRGLADYVFLVKVILAAWPARNRLLTCSYCRSVLPACTEKNHWHFSHVGTGRSHCMTWQLLADHLSMCRSSSPQDLAMISWPRVPSAGRPRCMTWLWLTYHVFNMQVTIPARPGYDKLITCSMCSSLWDHMFPVQVVLAAWPGSDAAGAGLGLWRGCQVAGRNAAPDAQRIRRRAG